MNKNILQLKNLRHSYKMGENTLEILKGINFSLQQGEWCCVYGASGSGKTTLLNLVGGLEQPTEGTVIIDGVDLATLSRKNTAGFRAKKIGFIFQSYHLLPELTALENVAIAGTIAGKSFYEAKKQASLLLDKVGLANRKMHHPKELSGGEQQRTAIARSLINDPVLLLADEPTGNLDPKTGETILELFKSLRQENPALTILMITHNMDIAQMASVSVNLREGILCD
ncbi:MAG: ABC transporter ATP-binding protein [Lentisphaeria bacterium]|nr:ABC transporter ATP-binding protein [Lentisphaeria bacterium]